MWFRHLSERVRYGMRRKVYRLVDSGYVSYIQLTNPRPQLGTKEWLIQTEQKYGGYVSGVPRRRVSDMDPRTPEQIRWGGMEGGDRMSDLRQGYGRYYERYLAPFVRRDDPITLVEVGILQGTGLAIWSDLFPRGRVIGLDIDLDIIRSNLSTLRRRGAFVNENVELYEFDAFENNADLFMKILQGDRIDVMIDDAVHFDRAIITTFESARPYHADAFVHLIEDNRSVHATLTTQFPELTVESFDKLTVISSVPALH